MDTSSVIFGENTSELLVPSDAEFMRIAFHGSDDEWSRLHADCENRRLAEAFARALTVAPPQYQEQVRQWLEAIRDMHPDL